MRTKIFFSCALLLSFISIPLASAQEAKKPLSLEEIENLLREGVAGKRVVAIVEEKGISFDVTAEVKERLRRAGAGPELIQGLEKVALERERRKVEEERQAEVEKRKGEERRLRAEEERRKVDTEKALSEERKKLEAERRALEELRRKLESSQSPAVPSIPQTSATKRAAGDVGLVDLGKKYLILVTKEGKLITLDLTERTKVTILESRDVTMGQIGLGSSAMVEYQTKDGKNVVTKIEFRPAR